MSTLSETRLTEQQYLAIERRADRKSEYRDGEMIAMVGASRKHNLIVINVASELRQQLKRSTCEVYAADMRVKVAPAGLYTYPDVVAVCGEPKFEDDQLDTLLNPTLLVEVLSESTEAYDRGRKFEQYRKLDSLKQYLLIAQDRRHLELFARRPDGQWVLSETTSADDTLPLTSIEAALAVAEVYEKVDVEDAAEQSGSEPQSRQQG